MIDPDSLRDHLAGGLFGLLVGDAVGVPYEFHQPEDLPPLSELEYEPPAEFSRAHRGVPPGTWSDDGAHALILLETLLQCGKLDLPEFARRLLAWYQHGYFAVDEVVFDVGIQTSTAIRQLLQGVPPKRSGRADEQANGNGSLMRVLPLALWHQGSDAELVADAHRQSVVTHGHIRSQVCCALYCLWARRTLQQAADPWADAVQTLRGIYWSESPEYAELEWSIRPDDSSPGNGSGYVVDCLRSARWAVAQGTYEQAIKAAISLGHDTDTTACVAGGIAGIRDGLTAIPLRWHTGLRGQELVNPLLQRLLAHHGI